MSHSVFASSFLLFHFVWLLCFTYLAIIELTCIVAIKSHGDAANFEQSEFVFVSLLDVLQESQEFLLSLLDVLCDL